MALSYKARRKLALLILVIGLPLYILLTLGVIGWANDTWWPGPQDRMPFWLELVVFIGTGLIWALPCRSIFRGIGQADPDAPPPR
ncbi:DUF2842 domain-containing protein [Pseudogemmobacter faecipullorum]|uniref:DUF2842 domain-containing protein n=1 Tax=Pseudogemmobacter faecipullorum TaxID=2755041 RepID=A0ABS8CML8_9RHOB|nr:DUF2842 domain-containing protein [Pseudogemmobacter faecipullorum]MCB5410631.1 DUF2842 domain-containing protein [Pseudogemmobacter faecipullorum]